MIRLEHVNITVPNIDHAIDFLIHLEPEFRVRHRGLSQETGRNWAHLGTDETYVAIEEPHLETTPGTQRTPYVDFGINHIGWVVSDVESIATRLSNAGYRRVDSNQLHHPYRKRIYFYDKAGFEWELIEYFTEDPNKRNEYEV